jgi:hypothetical protein
VTKVIAASPAHRSEERRTVIEVFGKRDGATGALQANRKEALAGLGLAGDAIVYLIEDPAHMVGRGVWRGPGLAVDGRVACRGRVPTVRDVRAYLEAATCGAAG